MANTQKKIEQFKKELMLIFGDFIDEKTITQILNEIVVQKLSLNTAIKTKIKFILTSIIESINEQKSGSYIPIQFFTAKEILEDISPVVLLKMQEIVITFKRRS